MGQPRLPQGRCGPQPVVHDEKKKSESIRKSRSVLTNLVTKRIDNLDDVQDVV